MSHLKEQIPTKILEMWGWASIGINIVLSALNFALVYFSSSLAVAAEMVHNIVDLVASIAVLVGIKLSSKQSKAFPYGLYKIENIVAASISILVFLAAYEIARESILGKQTKTFVSVWILGGVVLSILIPILFSFFEMKAGKAANSPALIADASEYRIHTFTSGLVLISLLGHMTGFHIERIAALGIVIVVIWTGWRLLSDSMRVLLDASLDAQTLIHIRELLLQEPLVEQIRSLTGRNAGRYRFVEAVIEARVRELEKADHLAQKLEKALQEKFPLLQRALIDIKPVNKETLCFALPIEKLAGPLCVHFGTAPFFQLVEYHFSKSEIIRKNIVVNPFSQEPRGRGIKVAHWLIDQKVDIVVTSDDMREKGPGYALFEAGIEIVITTKSNIEEAVQDGIESV